MPAYTVHAASLHTSESSNKDVIFDMQARDAETRRQREVMDHSDTIRKLNAAEADAETAQKAAAEARAAAEDAASAQVGLGCISDSGCARCWSSAPCSVLVCMCLCLCGCMCLCLCGCSVSSLMDALEGPSGCWC